MRYGSVCSGIEAATVAWHGLSWEPAWFSEIEPFPSAVLEHHYPNTPNLGDMTDFKEWENEPIDILVGGTPCQSFSVAGLRAGLADPRGNLMLTFGAIAAKYRPEWLVWENVPGVLSSNKGRDFGAFLGMLGELGYGFAYRVLDAQFFGVPQRRRRVFVVGCLGDWQRAAKVLFERESLCRNTAQGKGEKQDIAATLEASIGRSRGAGTPINMLTAHASLGKRASHYDVELGTGRVLPAISHTITTSNQRGDFTGESTWPAKTAGTLDASFGRLYGQDNQHIDAGASMFVSDVQTLAFRSNHSASMDMPVTVDKTPTLTTNAKYMAIAIAENTIGRSVTSGGNGTGFTKDVMYTLTTSNPHAVMYERKVRRLTPTECERLQGFPDDYTAINYRGKPTADAPRYKALGNSMAVPVMRWIGERIQAAGATYA